MDCASSGPTRMLLARFAEYSDGFARLLEAATAEVCIFDPDARRLELGRPERSSLLFRFLRASPMRRLHLTVHDTRYLEVECPRFMSVLAQFGGQIEARVTCGEARRIDDCFVVVDSLHVIRRPVASQARGALFENDAETAALQRERYQQIHGDSEPGLAVAPVGLG